MSTLHDAIHQAAQLHRAGRLSEAEQIYRRVLHIQPNWAQGYTQLAAVLFESNQIDAAIVATQTAIDRRHDNPAFCHSNLGVLYAKLGRYTEAASAYRNAIVADPRYAAAHYNLGNTLWQLNEFEAAEQSYHAAITLDSKLAGAHNGLGLSLYHRGDYLPAIEEFRIAIELDPLNIDAPLNTVLCFSRLGDCRAIEKTLRQTSLHAPELHSALLMSLNYEHGDDPAYILNESLEYNRRHIAPLASSIRPHTNDGDANRRLRIGYISPDFRQHSVAYFLKPTLENHDRKLFFIACYAEVEKPDAVTAACQQHADLWRSTVGLSHEQVAEQIRADGIDILIDLAGHTVDNRLPVLGSRPAPVQVTWLGYPTTTGASGIEYRLTDSIADPEMSDAFYTETLVRLSNALFSYQPPTNAPEIKPPPFLKNGFLTFGSFNDLMKVSPRTIELWSQLLSQIPQSRLILKALGLSSEPGRDRLLKQFARLGINADRLELLGWRSELASHLELYNRVDIALDTYPYNGTTTTCEALWMGVPVISLAGKTAVSRMGASILAQLGLADDWLAHDHAGYLSIASRWAGDPLVLGQIRQSLRGRFKQSSLADAAAFTRGLESRLRELWSAWCLSESSGDAVPQ